MICPECQSWTPGENLYCPYCGLSTEEIHSHFSWSLACSATLALVAALVFVYKNWWKAA